jgi:hypothetical protein
MWHACGVSRGAAELQTDVGITEHGEYPFAGQESGGSCPEFVVSALVTRGIYLRYFSFTEEGAR